MILILKKSLSLNHAHCFVPRKNAILYLQFFSSSAASQNPEPTTNSIADYLITSCGFSQQKAAAASKHISNRRFPSKPDSVRHFFKHHGFSDKDIQSIISNVPSILWADVDKTLEPNLLSLQRFVNSSDSELTRFVISNPRVLTNPYAFRRLEFWKTFLNNDMKKLLLVFSRNQGLIARDIDKNISPKITLLKNYGLSQTDIGMLLHRSSLIRRTSATIEVSLKQVQELGFPSGSSMFVHGLAVIGKINPDTFKAKMDLFKCLGWSESMFFAAFKKFPTIASLSEKNIREKMEFLVRRAGCTQTYIASRPVILGLSLEKRLMPRHQVWKILKSSELVGRDRGIYKFMCISERKFLETIIHTYEELVPNLRETYIAACANQISL